jgi:soluble lytic murein transglycosylase-like protein
MTAGIIATRFPALLPKLAATAVVCWVLGANTYFDSANASPVVLWNPHHHKTAAADADTPPALRILPAREAALYSDIFTAQTDKDWRKADQDIAKLHDKRLLGHVLADRFERRPASLAELKDWLSKYADLPEASGLYDTAVTLAGKDAANVPEPSGSGPWSGSDSYGSAFGFRAVADRNASAAARRFAAKLNTALHHNNPIAAENLLETERKHRIVPPHEGSSAEGLIAASFFYNGQITYARRMAEAGAKQQNPLALWFAGLTAWKQNDFVASGKSFALLAAQPDLSLWDRAAAQFWAARALKRAGDAKNARYWLEQSAHHPHSFYGLMAAHLLGNDNSWSWDLPPLDDQQIAMIAAQKAGGRALALLQIGQHDLAENELRRLNPQGRHDLQEAMLALANAEHMPSLALQLGGVAMKTNGTPYDAALYPLPPWQPEEGFKVDRALLYALIRHESQFDPLAVSDRGACGLMQLLPATAKLMTDNVADQAVAHDCSGRLLDPSFNMALGQRYVRHLTDQPLIGDNLMLLLAAYNEGPGNLARGLHPGEARSKTAMRGITSHREYEKEDPLLFLESIPTRQTHDYIERVLIHYWGYRARLGEPETSLTELAHGQWPRYAPPAATARPPKGTRDAALPAAKIELASSR